MKRISIISLPFLLGLIPVSYLGWWGLKYDNPQYVWGSFWGVLGILGVYAFVVFMGIIDGWLDDYNV